MSTQEAAKDKKTKQMKVKNLNKGIFVDVVLNMYVLTGEFNARQKNICQARQVYLN